MIEIVSKGAHAGAARVVLFDFDGTLSLIRAGWMDVMVPMMVDLLQQTAPERHRTIARVVLDYVGRTTGKETIYQMMELAGHIHGEAALRRNRLSIKECTWTGSGATLKTASKN